MSESDKIKELLAATEKRMRGIPLVSPDCMPGSLAAYQEALDRIGVELFFDMRGHRSFIDVRPDSIATRRGLSVGEQEVTDHVASLLDLILCEEVKVQKRIKEGGKTVLEMKPFTFQFGVAKRERAARAAEWLNRRDGFRDYLESNSANGTFSPDEYQIDSMLTTVFGAGTGAYEYELPLAQWVSRYIMLGAVQLAFEPGSKLDETAILIGPQKTGKSKFLEALVPAPRYFGSIDIDVDSKKWAEQLQGLAVAEVAEAKGMSDAKPCLLYTSPSPRD